MRALFIYLIISAIIEILNPLVAPKCLQCYYALQNDFTLFEFSILSYLYYLQFKSLITKKSVALIIFLYLIYSIYELTSSDNYLKHNTQIQAVSSVVLISLCILNYFRILYEMGRNDIKQEEYYFTFINAAILIYFAASFILFLFGDFIDHCPKKTFRTIWSLNLLENIVYNCFFAVGIWKHRGLKIS